MSNIHSESESTDENTILPSEADSPKTITDLEDESASMNVIFEEIYPISSKCNQYKEATNYDTLLSDQLLKAQEPLYSDTVSTYCTTSITSPFTSILEPSILTEKKIDGHITRKVDVREAKRYSSDNESCSTFRDSSDNEANIHKRKKNKVSDNTIRTSFQRNLSSAIPISSTADNTKYKYRQPEVQSCSKYRTVIKFSKSNFEIRSYFVPGNEDWKKLNMSLYNLDLNKVSRSHKEAEIETSSSSDFSKTSNNSQFSNSSQISSKQKYFKPSENDWKRLQWSVDESNWNTNESLFVNTDDIVDMKLSA
ncbi:21480_t:CDS:2 [Cetraspora pellucida]|uniref:21480_t:CDS:1 n=1 Tax=Cetraspora pellucida TaxID=1433469 RepID=A0A9N9HF81_9GLOM|nr:21480_t:CDS:2 [Cetraspora pellucida]